MKIFTSFSVKVDMPLLRTILLEPVILLYMMSIWMQFNLFTPLLFNKVCMRSYGNETFCSNVTREDLTADQEIQDESSRLMFWSNLCLTIPSIVLAPFLGSWGDRFGRKFPVILPATGAFLSAINYALCSGISRSPVELLLLSNLLQGLTGGFTGVILAVSSWAASLSSVRIRTSRLGFIEFANLFGTAVAPAIGGAVAQYWGYPWAFGLAGSLNLLQIVYVVFFLRTTESSQTIAPSNICRDLWKVESLRQIVTFLKETGRNLEARSSISMAAFCLTATWIVSTGTNEVRYLFIKTLKLSWDVLEYNFFAAEDAAIRAITLVTILPVLKHVLHARDFAIIFAGLISKTAMFAMWAAAKSSVVIFLAPVAGFLAAAVSACGRSAASKCVQKSDQGKLFAFLAILENLSSLTGSLVFQNTYQGTLSWFPGFPFVLADILLLIPIAFLLCFMPAVGESESNDATGYSSSQQDDLKCFADDEVIESSLRDGSQEDLSFT